jgi:outer membrane protein insertion porin family
MPVVNAPFRLYWAYNLSRVNTVLTPPVLVTPSMFPNEATYQSAVNTLQGLGLGIPFSEKHSTFRFSIGRTF